MQFGLLVAAGEVGEETMQTMWWWRVGTFAWTIYLDVRWHDGGVGVDDSDDLHNTLHMRSQSAPPSPQGTPPLAHSPL